ncbi:MAG: FdhF/YdeP family oxidoreductase [Planctomycetes bacterium]|nr:FdhF/YdeP family oxidoreductase [Planctomycetota bacterium]
MPREPRSRRELAHGWVPFGIGETKPHHYLEMVKIAWENRDSLGYAWKVLSQGVCDGCALGTSGLSDWTIDGTHLCLIRLNLLRLNTMGALEPALLADAAALRRRTSKELRALGRIPYPMRRLLGEAGFTRVSWEELWADVGARWRGFAPERTALYLTSRGITNEVYYVAQKVMRFLGSSNVDNSARLCHAPSTGALKATLGVAATTCSYRDWYEADLIVFFGSNPANDQPVTMKYLAEARRRGARVLSVNAYREPGLERYWVPSNWDSALFGTRIVDRTFLVKVGGDLAFLTAAQKVLVAHGRQKREFIDAATTGFPELAAALEREPMDVLLARCGATAADVEAFAREVGTADRGIFVWSMGITQHAGAVDTVKGIVNLGLLREFVGRPGTGMMPIRGHSGVQGGAEMGAYATALPGGLPVTEENARRFSELWGFKVPAAKGLSAVDMIEAAGEGRLDGFYCIGGNFLETLPQPERVEAALGRIPLRLHSDIVVTSQMLVEPAEVVYLLPARTRYEQKDGGTETTTERRVIFSPHIAGHDIGEARSEWELLLDLAKAVRPEAFEKVRFGSGAEIRADIERAVPFYAGIAGLAKQGDQFQWGGPMLCAERRFPTSDGKAHFQPVAVSGGPGGGAGGAGGAGGVCGGSGAGAGAGSAATFVLATRRGKQFNSMIQANRDSLTGAERDHVFVSPTDAARLGLATGDPIVLRNATGEFRGRAFVADVAVGTLQGHWPEVNVLLPRGVVDEAAGIPDYNAEVTLARAEERP